MERETTKHGPLLDGAMADEQARLSAREDATGLAPEGDDDLPGEPAPPAQGARPSPMDDVTVGARERAVRRQIKEQLEGARFPADRNALLRHIGADGRGAVHAHLRSLPSDIRFSSADEVATAFGGVRSAE